MASTKKPAPKTAPAKPVEQTNSAPAPEMTMNAPAVPVKLDDSLLVRVQSNVAGKLVYENPRTGSRIVWDNFGDVQIVPMSDLRAMKAGYRRFFEDNWVIVKGIEDYGYENVSCEDIYKALAVAQYYKSILDPDHFDDFFRLDEREMKRRIELMTDGAKLNLVVAANSAIENGVLDSIRVVKMLEKLLGCELLELK